MEEITQTIGTLTSLIGVNNTREKVYKSLAEKMRHKELKSLFTKYAEQSRQFSSALSNWRAAYGGFAMPEAEGAIGSVRARIAAVMEFWLGKDVVSKCEEIERDTLREYRAAMRMSVLPTAAAADVQQQSREVEKALTRLRTLREHLGSNGSVRDELMHTAVI